MAARSQIVSYEKKAIRKQLRAHCEWFPFSETEYKDGKKKQPVSGGHRSREYLRNRKEEVRRRWENLTA